MSPRIPAVLAVALLAVLSCVSFPVTDSWFSDTDSVDVSVELDRTQEVLESFSILDEDLNRLQVNEDDSYTLASDYGPYTLVANRDVTLKIVEGDASSNVSVSITDESGADVLSDSTFHAIAHQSYTISVNNGSVSVTEVPST